MKMSMAGQPKRHLWLVFTMLFVTSAMHGEGASSFAPPSLSISPAYDPVIKVVGKVYCYRCFNEAHPDESHGKKHLEGAMVKVTCQANDQALVAFGYTRSNGKYSVILKGLPISSSSNYGADSCKVELHGAPGGSDCNVPIELNLSGLSVYSRSSEEVVFKANQIMAFASKNAFGCSKPQTQSSSSSPMHPYYSSPPLIPHQYPSPPPATHRSPPPLPLPYQYSPPPAANQLPSSPAYQYHSPPPQNYYTSPPPYQYQQPMLPNSYQTPPPPQGTESPVQPNKYLPPPYYYNSPPPQHQHNYVPPLAYQYPPPPYIHTSPLLPSSPAAPYHYNSPPTYQYPPPPYNYQSSPPPAQYSPPLPPNAPGHLRPSVPHAKSPQPLHIPPPPNDVVPSPTTPPLHYYKSPPPTDQLS